MDLRLSLNEVARERAKNEQIKEINDGEEEVLEFNPDIEDVAYWIQRELQYSKGYLSQDPEIRRLQIEWSLKFLQIKQLQDIYFELENITMDLRKLRLN